MPPEEAIPPGFEQVPAVPDQQPEAPETGAALETPRPAVERQVAPESAAPTASAAPALRPEPVVKDPTVKSIESILEEDLGDTYKKMTPALQAKFRKEGERVAGLIAVMVHHAKINARIVLKLIVGWLKLIPGVNHFFLEQEAKIKTDRILKL